MPEQFIKKSHCLGIWALDLVCEDLWHPSLTYLAALRGADVVVALTAVPGRGATESGDGLVFSSMDRWLSMATALASFHQIWVVVANPGIHISTAEAFGDVTPIPRSTDWNALSTLPVSAWRDVIQNDFEVGARQRHPEVGRLIDALAEAGAAHAQMTGSGSTVFGLFEREGIAREAARLTQAQFCGPIFRDC